MNQPGPTGTPDPGSQMEQGESQAPGSRLLDTASPGALGCTPSPEPSSVWARRPSIVSGGSAVSLRPGLLAAGLAHGFLSMPVHCHCPSDPHRSWRGGQTQHSAQTHSSVVCEFFSVPPSRTSIPTARCCPTLPPESVNPATFLPSSPPSPPCLDPLICYNCSPDAAAVPLCSLIPAPAFIKNLPLHPGCPQGDYRKTGHCPTGSQLLFTNTALRWPPHLAQREWPRAGLPSDLSAAQEASGHRTPPRPLHGSLPALPPRLLPRGAPVLRGQDPSHRAHAAPVSAAAGTCSGLRINRVAEGARGLLRARASLAVNCVAGWARPACPPCRGHTSSTQSGGP